MAEEQNEQNTQEVDVQALRDEIKSLRAESAKRRIERNELLRKNSALSKVLNSHNIRFDVEEHDLSHLNIVDGAVEGEFDYSPPKQQQRVTVKSSEPDQPKQLTAKDVAGMTADQINENWDQIKNIEGIFEDM